MADSHNTGWSLGDTLRSLQSGVLTTALIVGLVWPRFFVGRLRDAGLQIKELGTNGLTLEGIEQANSAAKRAGGDVAAATQVLPEADELLTRAKQSTDLTVVRKLIDQASQRIGQSLDHAEAADTALSSALLIQQQALQTAAPTASIPNGWLYLGRVDSKKGEWKGKSPYPVAWAQWRKPTMAVGNLLTLDGSAALRAEPAAASGKHASGGIVAVLSKGTSVRIEEVQFIPSYPDGYFLGCRVRLDAT